MERERRSRLSLSFYLLRATSVYRSQVSSSSPLSIYLFFFLPKIQNEILGRVCSKRGDRKGRTHVPDAWKIVLLIDKTTKSTTRHGNSRIFSQKNCSRDPSEEFLRFFLFFCGNEKIQMKKKDGGSYLWIESDWLGRVTWEGSTCRTCFVEIENYFVMNRD